MIAAILCFMIIALFSEGVHWRCYDCEIYRNFLELLVRCACEEGRRWKEVYGFGIRRRRESFFGSERRWSITQKNESYQIQTHHDASQLKGAM